MADETQESTTGTTAPPPMFDPNTMTLLEDDSVSDSTNEEQAPKESEPEEVEVEETPEDEPQPKKNPDRMTDKALQQEQQRRATAERKVAEYKAQIKALEDQIALRAVSEKVEPDPLDGMDDDDVLTIAQAKKIMAKVRPDTKSSDAVARLEAQVQALKNELDAERQWDAFSRQFAAKNPDHDVQLFVETYQDEMRYVNPNLDEDSMREASEKAYRRAFEASKRVDSKPAQPSRKPPKSTEGTQVVNPSASLNTKPVEKQPDRFDPFKHPLIMDDD